MNWQESVFRLNGYPIDKAKEDLSRIMAMSNNKFLANRQEAAWELVNYHAERNPFYREQLGGRLPANWADLPVLEKTHYQRPLGSMISSDYTVGQLFVSKTSGSSGHPMYFARDKYAHARNWAYVMNRYFELNIPVGQRMAWFFGMPREKLPRLRERIKDWLMNRYRFVVFDLSETAMEAIVDRFQHDRFVGIYGYTHSIVHFAKYLKQSSRCLRTLCPSLRRVIVTSEVCTAADRAIVEEALGVPVSSEYGASEFGYIGCDIGHDRWQVASENVLVEIIPMQEWTPEAYGGRVLVTDLNNKAFPFIRFAIGDIGFIEPALLSGRHKVLTQLMGRTNDMAILPSGRVVPGLVFYYVSKSIIEKAKNIRQYAIRQLTKTEFEFIIESITPLPREIEEQIKTDVIGYLEPGLSISFRYDSVAKTTSGKIKHFFSLVES